MLIQVLFQDKYQDHPEALRYPTSGQDQQLQEAELDKLTKSEFKRRINKNWLHNARTTGKIAPIVSVVLYQFDHICSMLPKLSASIKASLPVQDAERKYPK